MPFCPPFIFPKYYPECEIPSANPQSINTLEKSMALWWLLYSATVNYKIRTIGSNTGGCAPPNENPDVTVTDSQTITFPSPHQKMCGSNSLFYMRPVNDKELMFEWTFGYDPSLNNYDFCETYGQSFVLNSDPTDLSGYDVSDDISNQVITLNLPGKTLSYDLFFHYLSFPPIEERAVQVIVEEMNFTFEPWVPAA